MVWMHPGTILLLLLFLYFLAGKRWKVALAVIGFIFITGRVAPPLERALGPARPESGIALSILLIAGCVWFLVVAVVARLGGTHGERRKGG